MDKVGGNPADRVVTHDWLVTYKMPILKPRQWRQIVGNKTGSRCPLWLFCIGAIMLLNACTAGSNIPAGESQYISWTGASPFVRPVWSPDGTHLVLEEAHPRDMSVAHLALYRLEDGRLIPLTYTLGYYTSISWSPDSTKLAVTRENDRAYGKDVQIIDLATKQTETIGLGDGVAWAPDGRHIAIYVGPNPNTHQGQFAIKVVQPDGTSIKTIPLPITPTIQGPTPVPATAAPGQLFNIPPLQSQDLFGGMSWSPDSQRIVLSIMRVPSSSDFTGDLYIVDMTGNDHQKITSSGLNHEPAWSPDGKNIAYLKGPRLTSGQLYLIRPDGSCFSSAFAKVSASSISWSPDSNRIAYEDRNGIYILDVKKKLASDTPPNNSCP